MESAADKHMVAILDNNNYNEDDLVLLKFALYAPYIQSNSSYQRCDGQIELNGTQYNYVKRMVHNDTLYLYCIPNNQKTELNNSKHLYASNYSDNSNDKKAERAFLNQFNFGIEYNTVLTEFNFDAYISVPRKIAALNNCTILKGFTLKTIQPPDLFI